MHTNRADPVPRILMAVGVVLAFAVVLVSSREEKSPAANATVSRDSSLRQAVPAHVAPVQQAQPKQDYRYRPLSSPVDYLAGFALNSGSIVMYEGPGEHYQRLSLVPKGERVLGVGIATTRNGSTWNHITRADGSYGFVKAGTLREAPAELAQAQSSLADSSSQASRRSGNWNRTEDSSRGIRDEDPSRHARPNGVAPPGTIQSELIKCVMPSGQIEQLPQSECRQRAGVVYR